MNTSPEPKNLLAQAWFMFEKTRYMRAIRLAERAIQFSESGSETNINALFLLLKCYNRFQRLDAATETAKELMRLGATNADLHMELAVLARLKQDQDEYTRQLQQALALAPENRSLKIEHLLSKIREDHQEDATTAPETLGELHALAGGIDAINIANPENISLLDALSARGLLDNDWKSKLDAYLQDALVESISHARIGFLLAQQARVEDNPEVEAHYLLKANAMLEKLEKNLGREWSLDKNNRATEQLKRLFPDASEYWAGLEGSTGLAPIVILNLPCSGAERFAKLVGHCDSVADGGECRSLRYAVKRVANKIFPENESDSEELGLEQIKQLEAPQLHEIAEHYIREQRHISNAPYITDALYSNILRVGLIANLFPAAKFVHIERDCIDTCLDIYRSPLTNIPYATSISHTAQAYAVCRSRVDHWRSIYPDRFSYVSYNELTENPDKVLADFCSFAQIEMPEIFSREAVQNAASTEKKLALLEELGIKNMDRIVAGANNLVS